MSFNTAYLNTSTHGSKDFTAGLDEIVISMDIDWSDGVDRGTLSIPKHYAKVDVDSILANGEYQDFKRRSVFRFEFRPQFGFHLKPFEEHKDNLIGPMGNGVFAEVSSIITDQLSKMVGYPISKYIPVHDRYETQEMYDVLCR